MVTRDCRNRGNTIFCELQLLPDGEKDLVKAEKEMHTNTHIPAFITLLILFRVLKSLIKLTSEIKQEILEYDCNLELFFIHNFLYVFVDRVNQPCTSPVVSIKTATTLETLDFSKIWRYSALCIMLICKGRIYSLAKLLRKLERKAKIPSTPKIFIQSNEWLENLTLFRKYSLLQIKIIF